MNTNKYRKPTGAGSATIGIDRVTKEALKSLAANDRTTIADKVRELVGDAVKKEPQAALKMDLPPVPATKADINALIDVVRGMAAMPFILSALPFAGKDAIKVSRNIQDTLDYMEAQMIESVKVQMKQARESLKNTESESVQGEFAET